MVTKIPKNYKPTAKEKYMCAKHKAFFRQLLSKWKNDLIDQNNRIIFGNSDDNASSADIVDQATSYSGKTVEMRTVNRNKKLISKIDGSLKKIDEGTYGFCEETGEEIGLKRLIAVSYTHLTLPTKRIV